MDRIAQIEYILKNLLKNHELETSPGFAVCGDSSIFENIFKESVIQSKILLESDEQFNWIINYPDINCLVEGDYYWDYVTFGLKILKCLNDYIMTETKDQLESHKHALLNINQQNYVKTMCEFIFCLGVGRNLLPGLGIPWEKRSKFISFISKNGKCNLHQKQLQIYTTISTLMEIAQYHIIGNLIFSKCLQDILAGLCQLAYWPLKKITEPGIDALSQERNEQIQIRLSSREMLQNVLERAYQPKVIRELLFIQGISKKTELSNEVIPNYIRKCVGSLLSERLLKKRGIKSFILAILDSGEDEEKVEQREWVKCEVVVHIVASLGRQESHLYSICSQILHLLDDNSEDLERRHHFITFGKLITEGIIRVNKEQADQLIFKSLFKELIECTRNEIQTVLPSEKELEVCIEKLHKIFTLQTAACKSFIEYLSPVISVIFFIHSFLYEGSSHLRTFTENLLISYLKSSENFDSCKFLKKTLFTFETENESDTLTWNPTVTLSYGEDGGVCLKKQELSSSYRDWLKTDEINTAAFINLITIANDDKLSLSIFLSLLKNLSSSFDTSPIEQKFNESFSLLEIENNNSKKEIHVRKSLISLNILSTLCQHVSLHKAISNDKLKVIRFIETILERGAKQCETNQLLETTNNETLQMTMSLLTLIIDEQDFSTIKKEATSILSSLTILAEEHVDANIRTLSEELRKFLLTMGAIPVQLQPKPSNIKNIPTTQQKKKQASGETGASTYQLILNDLYDSDIPSKGHALLACTKLIQAKDKELFEDKEKLLYLLMENLDHEDSYVYLMATQAIAALATEFPNTILPILLDAYANASNFQLQMKVGEVILKLVTQLNDAVVKYKDVLINSFLNATKNDDPLIRASNLSNLGQLCKQLKFSFGNNVYEIVHHLSNFAKYDSNSNVRSAAVQVFTLLLSGLGKDSIKVLDAALKDIYRLLKHIYLVDKDDVVKLHVQLALKEMDVLCREFLFPNQVLEKKIQILDKT